MMHIYKLFFLSFFLVILTSCNQYKNIEIIFEDGFIYSSQKDLITNLKSTNSKEGIKEILLNQDWIEDFKVVFRINGNVKINIITKIPLFIWNDKYYIDRKLNTFNFDKTDNYLIKVFCPSNQIEDASKLIKYINNTETLSKFSFNKLDFKYSSGWTLFFEDSLTIKFGKDISETRLNSFKQSLNYVYENNSIPSMIDLRYKDGVALNYGK